MDESRIYQTSLVAGLIVHGLALLLAIVAVGILGGLLPVSRGGIVEAPLFAIAAGGMAFGLRQVVRKTVMPRMFEPGPIDPEILEEYKPFRTHVMLIWSAVLAGGLLLMAFPLEIIREGSAFAFGAAILVMSQDKSVVEYYLLKTEE